jgi:hypothetical protein
MLQSMWCSQFLLTALLFQKKFFLKAGELFLRFYKSIYSYADHRFFSAMVSRVNANWGRAKAFCG